MIVGRKNVYLKMAFTKNAAVFYPQNRYEVYRMFSKILLPSVFLFPRKKIIAKLLLSNLEKDYLTVIIGSQCLEKFTVILGVSEKRFECYTLLKDNIKN